MSLPLVVAITGASGVIYGIEILRALKTLEVPTHLIVSEAGVRTLMLETEIPLAEVKALADVVHANKDIAASISSGSFLTRGMIVAPCSIKTLSSITNSYDADLVSRAADVTLKERRPLVLMVRETPLHKGHLDLMARAADYGATILPPMPAFYHKPETLQDIIDQGVARALDQLGVTHALFPRWSDDKS
ncbi:MAG: UbiX family flavin prenyltransferase [Alphaproteobacteria bacterium]|jgi:4-hydroxy-3-polyprenylbenzoate decarboxylase